MWHFKKYIFLFSCAIFSGIYFFTSCSSSVTKKKQTLNTETKILSLSYAKRFGAAMVNGYKTLYLFGNRNSNDTTAVFILYPKNEKKPNLDPNAFYVGIPVAKVACLSSVYVNMLQKLDLLQTICAVDNVDYYNNPYIIDGVAKNTIKEIAKGPEINAEQTLLLKPDLLLTFGMGNPKKDVNEKVINAGIPAAVTLDHLEETPLARAEWIKFIASFFDKNALADSLFKLTENNYLQLRAMVDTVRTKPTVFTEMKYSDAWYVPGGESFMAHLLKDAGSDYIWKDEKKTGSIPLNFESVYTKAKDADYWLNLFITVNSKKDLLGFEERYNLFSAFKKGNIYNNNRTVNAKGYSIYWEEGICNPDELLRDLIFIFHPAQLPQHSLKYYKKIE